LSSGASILSRRRMNPAAAKQGGRALVLSGGNRSDKGHYLCRSVGCRRPSWVVRVTIMHGRSGASVGVSDNGQLRDWDWPLETEYFAIHWGERGWLYRWREEAKRFRLIGSYRPQSCDAIFPSIPPSELKPMSLWPRGGLVPFSRRFGAVTARE